MRCAFAMHVARLSTPRTGVVRRSTGTSIPRPRERHSMRSTPSSSRMVERTGVQGSIPRCGLEVHVIRDPGARDDAAPGDHRSATSSPSPSHRSSAVAGRCPRAGTPNNCTSSSSHRRASACSPAFWLAANTYMRRSELLVLRWGDVDLTTRTSRSTERSCRCRTSYTSRGKTRNSSRWMDLDAPTCTMLAQLAPQTRSGVPSARPGRRLRFCSADRQSFTRGITVFTAAPGATSSRTSRPSPHAHSFGAVPVMGGQRSAPRAVSDGHDQHVLPCVQAEAARTFASVLASTGFNPVDEPVEVANAMKPWPEVF